MKWLWMLIWDPVKALDLEEANGDIDHGKLIGMLVLLIFIYLVVREAGWPPLGQASLFVSAAFGARMFYRYLQRSSFTATETVTRTEPNYRTDDERGA